MTTLSNAIASLKGLAGTGTVLSRVVESLEDRLMTLEPGDITSKNNLQAAPIGHDLWYLWYHQNLMQKHYADQEADFKHYDYTTYLSNNLSFLSYLPGLKPLKVLTDLKSLDVEEGFGSIIPNQYANNGIYWINTIFFELWNQKYSPRYNSDAKEIPHYEREYSGGRYHVVIDHTTAPTYGSKGYLEKPTEYVGYIAFPIGQMGVMEVISLFQETDLSGYAFEDVDALGAYHQKPAVSNLEDKDKPTIQSTPEMFPDMKDSNGNQLAGMNYCYGKHLIESAYLKPVIPMAQQNTLNSDLNTAYAPVADRDVELWGPDIKDYGETVDPKLWMRFWIHKDSTMPVPGEFIGILVRPVACPPHVWWFQESAPLLYAGNWVETKTLTSGVVTEVILEAARTDGGTGNLYKVSIQGCIVEIAASDFLLYAVGDRVAILKTDCIAPATQSYSSNEQTYLKDSDSFTKTLVINTKYTILPIVFYRKIT
jgi:hypothetical protein